MDGGSAGAVGSGSSKNLEGLLRHACPALNGKPLSKYELNANDRQFT